MTSPRSPRRRADDARRTELLTAARSVIAKEGVAAATTRRITEEAGLPHGAFHYWFSGKEELFEELIAEVIRELGEGIATAAGIEGSSDTSLRDHLRAAFHVVRRDEQVEPGRQLAMYELTALALRTPALRDMARRQYQAYREATTAVTAPWLAARDIEVPGGAKTLGRLITALFDGLVLAWLADPEGSDPDEVFTLIDTLVSCHRSASKGSNPS